MIQIAGSAQRSFVFPANLRDAFAYYADIQRSFRFLAHISVLKTDVGGQYRLLYSSLESGLYKVKITCDVLAVIDADQHMIQIIPMEGDAPKRAQAGLYSMTGQGVYNSQIQFSKYGDQTRIEYSMEMKASLPVALTLRWIPGELMDGIAQHKFHLHTGEIIDSFIERSIKAYELDQSKK